MTALPALHQTPADARARSRWDDAVLAARIFAVDPVGLGGVVVAGGPGPARDLWFDRLAAILPRATPVRRIPAGIADDRLIGGVDLVATLASGKAVLQRGLLAEADGGVAVILMAERLEPGKAARIAAVLDRQEVTVEREGIATRLPARIGIVAFDESVGEDECVPESLTQRLAFQIDLAGLRPTDAGEPKPDAAATVAARERLTAIGPTPHQFLEALTATAMALGIESVVAALLAVRAARAAAALSGRTSIAEEDAILAARLVLAPRATRAPEVEDDDTQDDDTETEAETDTNPVEPEAQSDQEPNDRPEDGPDLDEIMLEAVKAALPAGLLEALRQGKADRSNPGQRNGTGSVKRSLERGRPVGSRAGTPRPGVRLAIVDTLRAAAPWQPVRRAQAPDAGGAILLRREDFRLRTFVQRREATIVFCVDASGSAAFQRLAEAKGAVELLLADAYVARTHAALIAFRGQSADLLLPPTRSLSRAKVQLASLPGGGGTPLAAGIDAALATALGERAKGRDPLLILLTDGRANIARDGRPSRPLALEDAHEAARQVAASRIRAVFIDTSPRPAPGGAELAAAMGARYVALPYLDAAAVRDVAMR
jgi:magnesium chelatase subunit D